MELDTRSAISIIPRNLCTKHFQSVELRPLKILLRSYLNELKPTEGSLSLNVQHGTSFRDMEAFVVDVEGSPPVFGRSWLEVLNLDWKSNQ